MYVFKDKKVRNDVLRKGGNQMKIIVTPEEMSSNATNIRTEKANFEQCISSMRTIVNSMSGVFEGEAATAFVSNFTLSTTTSTSASISI